MKVFERMCASASTNPCFQLELYRTCLVQVLNSSCIAYTSQPSLVEQKQPQMRHLQVIWLPASRVPALGNTQVHFVWLPALVQAAHEHGDWLPA